MRAVLQRVSKADVSIDGEIFSQIDKGLLILLGVQEGDTSADVEYTVRKCVNMRIFGDDEGKLNLSVKDIGGELLVVSQFTLLGDSRHGNRPSFIAAGRPQETEKIYLSAVEEFKKSGLNVKTGKFGADMKVSLVNDGPVTIMLDSRKVF